MTSNRDESLGFHPLSMALAWLWPGLGHIARGERQRGILIMSGVLFLFLGGLLIGGIDAVDRREDALWFVAQAGCGPIAFVADMGNTALLKNGPPESMVSTPVGAASTNKGGKVSKRKALAHVNEFGTLYIALAGLMNAVIVLDAGFRRSRTTGSSAA
ncbi:MAG: hypothetical protein KDA22_09115 [Phycisphaerales bacterium]|nr:hypothetical protein [Phycisphaerales bacterium]